jgi:glutathione gamma-glutamylcysteinyltransferase
MDTASFYRRPLPAPAIAFSSIEGRQIFQEALAMGSMAGYFPLAEQFHTQAEPAFCGLSTLVIILNALSIDPKRIWKGVWRWYVEDFLDCCLPLPSIKEHGITFDEFVCLARCNGAIVTPYRHAHSSLTEFREIVQQACTTPEGMHLVVSYSRQILGQTGDGHFSPIGGYHPQRDLVLLLDVARFKYPPHWVPLSLVWQALEPLDSTTHKCRGYITLRKSDRLQDTFFHIALDLQMWQKIAPYFAKIIPTALAIAQPTTPIAVIRTILQNLPENHLEILGFAADRASIPTALQQAIQSHPMLPLVEEALSESPARIASLRRSPQAVETITVILLACPESLYQQLQPPLQHWFNEIRQPETMASLLAQEIQKLREQIGALQELCQIS